MRKKIKTKPILSITKKPKKMKNLIKKAAVVAVATVVSMSASAQAGQMAVGGNLAVGIGDGYTNLGIGPKFQYGITNQVRGEASFTYFLEKDQLSMWDLSVNAHYLFPVAPQITVYPLAGLSVQGWTVDIPEVSIPGIGSIGGDVSDTDFGLNLGGGGEYQLTETLSISAELKYHIGGEFNRLYISAGVAYKF
jgi:outer membrane protein X